MNRRSWVPAGRRLLVAAAVVAGCSGGLSRDPLGGTRQHSGGSAGVVTAEGGYPTGGSTSSKAGKGGAGTGGVAGDEPVSSSGGMNRGGSGGTGGTGSGSRGGSGVGGSGAGGNGVGGSVAGSGQPGGGGVGGGGASGAAGQAGESGAAGDAGEGNASNCAGTGPVLISTFGLVYWFSADFGVTTESDGNISEWCDRSGNGAHATQRSAGPRPNLSTFPGTDLPAILFDGVDEYLDLPPLETSFEGGLTFFCVARATVNSNGMAMLKLSNGPEANDVTFLRFVEAFTYEVADEPKWGGDFAVGEPRLVDVGHAMNGIVSMFMNGMSVADASFPTPFPITRTQNFIGRTDYEASTTWTGEIAEIMLYDRLLALEDRQTIRSYLSEKWNCCD